MGGAIPNSLGRAAMSSAEPRDSRSERYDWGPDKTDAETGAEGCFVVDGSVAEEFETIDVFAVVTNESGSCVDVDVDVDVPAMCWLLSREFRRSNTALASDVLELASDVLEFPSPSLLDSEVDIIKPANKPPSL